MYGKVFASMYEGSLVGAGPIVFSVWTYALAKAEPQFSEQKMVVTLNPVILASAIGQTTPEEVRKAIAFLCAPDPHSRSPAEGGKRLLQVAPLDYLIVNGWKYREMRHQQSRRESNRLAQSRWRQKQRAQAIGKVAQLGNRVAGIPEEASNP